MSRKSFSEQHQFLLEQLSDVRVFEGEKWNFFKIAQHAFIYANNGDQSKLLETRWNKPLWMLKLIFKVKRWRNKGMGDIPKLSPLLFLDEGRYTTDNQGVKHSVYFERILDLVPSDDRMVIQLGGDADLGADYSMASVKAAIGSARVDQHLSDMIAECKAVVARVNAAAFSDQQRHYFASAMQVFLEEFAFYNTFFSDQHVSKCFFCTHYHREGLIAAAAVHNVEMIELQHGLIAENDLYYAYPDYVLKASKPAFFPDKLLLFGEYWREVVLRGNERNPADCLTVGDYSFSTPNPAVNKADVIFIGAQKNMARPYVDYVHSLLKTLESSHPNWKIKLKMHPLEKEVDVYQSVSHPQFELIGNEGDLHVLLAECRIQISIYSTTFFDALGMEVVNFSLQNFTEFADYAADMIKEKVAFPLEFDQDPISEHARLISEQKALLSRDSVYAPLDENTLRGVLEIR